MNRTLINFVTDALVAFTMLSIVATGIVLRYALPPGTSQVYSLWGWTRHQWGDLHFWLAVAALGIVLIHLILHWAWVVTVTHRWIVGARRGSPSVQARRAAGVATLIVLTLSLAGFWKWSMASIRPVAFPADSAEASPRHVDHLRGSMTLAEAASTLGCTTQEIRSRLSLPDQTRETEHLAQIAQQMGVDMHELRQRLR